MIGNRIVLLCSLLFLTLFVQAQKQWNKIGKTWYFDNSVTWINGADTALNFLPGDTIQLQAGIRPYLRFDDIRGSADSAIVIVNGAGLVTVQSDFHYGILFNHCSHIKITGEGVSTIAYGIKVCDVKGNGISADKLTTNIEICHTEISNVLFAGIVVKTDPDCSLASVRQNFVLRNLRVHHNYIHDVGNEGMYIGHSHYTGVTLHCNDKDTIVEPHILDTVDISYNRLENIGWDGLQISSSRHHCNIHDNYVYKDSQEEVFNQMSGILVGGGSDCNCYNNYIEDGKGDGIDLMGVGNQLVYNNIIVNPGQKIETKTPKELPKQGIFVKDIATIGGSYIHLLNNTIINPRTDGINFSNGETSNSIIANNIIINPGSYGTIGDRAYINTYLIIPNFTASNNLLLQNIELALFTNPALHDFSLKKLSPAVESGLDVSAWGISYDISGKGRPHGLHYDIGAYEYQGVIGIQHYKKAIQLKIWPNPVSEALQFSVPYPGEGIVNIFRLNGQLCLTQSIVSCTPNQPLTIMINHLTPGYYLLSMKQQNKLYQSAFLVRR